jgi:membrane protease YdiL (CAAX protease family)
LTVFALFSHRRSPHFVWGAMGLLVAAAAIAWSLHRAARPGSLLGLEALRGKTVWWSVLGLALGGGAAMLYQSQQGMFAWPSGHLGPFAAMACLIGATEELVYRGWLQGTVRPFGRPAAVIIAGVAHAAYKTALFAWPPFPIAADLTAMAGWTFAAGLGAGVLRESSGSVIPPMVAHAAFDLVVYGALAQAPWWVWS